MSTFLEHGVIFLRPLDINLQTKMEDNVDERGLSVRHIIIKSKLKIERTKTSIFTIIVAILETPFMCHTGRGVSVSRRQRSVRADINKTAQIFCFYKREKKGRKSCHQNIMSQDHIESNQNL